jgi:hypothetical protein
MTDAAIATGNLFEEGDVTLPTVLSAGADAIGVLCRLRMNVTHTPAGPG